ncbi:MAG: peptidase, partial [Gemmataceae bacterium]
MLRRRFSAWPITILALSILATTLSAATPVLNGVSPRGVQRGKDVVLVFSGARLADAKEVLFYTPGFQVGKLEVVNDAQVKVTVNIPATCDLGEHAVRLRTQSGLSELRTFWVGA